MKVAKHERSTASALSTDDLFLAKSILLLRKRSCIPRNMYSDKDSGPFGQSLAYTIVKYVSVRK